MLLWCITLIKKGFVLWNSRIQSSYTYLLQRCTKSQKGRSCCGTVAYDREDKTCCKGVHGPVYKSCCNEVLNKKERSCCGTKSYDRAYNTCCNDVLNRAWGRSCCGTIAYNLASKQCCNDVLC